ncbi:EKC/KEOPS complex subunit Cgi121p [[Candida] jaroonii]|uniref:EKC/KEOPS complex subunit Cgi121p n=1 Tax=[Candida] jaroonii TaxID=467808 RepID=A0ACA9YCW5_9ASCO|nr:EKC/KEOPS complex subunit Cgi121p [[Candida] jaroonii]
MAFLSTKFPSFDKTIFISLLVDVDQHTLEEVKTKLIEGNKDYDFAFFNTNYIISKEHLLNGIHRAMINYKNGSAKSKTLNTEIILNMSPVSNIMEALKRFGIDSSKESANLLCVKVIDDDESLEDINNTLITNLGVSKDQNVELTDDFLLKSVDVAKFKKLYKLNDAKYNDKKPLQNQLTRLAIGACLLRGT